MEFGYFFIVIVCMIGSVGYGHGLRVFLSLKGNGRQDNHGFGF